MTAELFCGITPEVDRDGQCKAAGQPEQRSDKEGNGFFLAIAGWPINSLVNMTRCR
jgi:hypothetical protein